jgi:methylated-DNA-protein-cysteine methyltransferase-like protein
MASKKQSDFFEKVYEVVAKIPPGKVTTYGAIANILGVGGSARTVGWALNASITTNQPSLPCHRVVNRLGQLTGKIHFGNGVMEFLLRSEGITFIDEDTIDIKVHFWNPTELLEKD